MIFPEPGATWSQSVYMCATAARARIAETSFTYNGTGDLPNLQIRYSYLNTSEKSETTPVWALEDTKLNSSSGNALWGIVPKKYENYPGLQTIAQDSFWLPAGRDGNRMDTVMSAAVHTEILSAMYNWDTSNYTGCGNQAVMNKWRKLGKTPEGISAMIDLVYVDRMTQLIVGSKSMLLAFKSGADDINVPINVQIFNHRIEYNKLYAIPVCPLPTTHEI
jgi:hypothetical protein